MKIRRKDTSAPATEGDFLVLDEAGGTAGEDGPTSGAEAIAAEVGPVDGMPAMVGPAGSAA